MPDAVCPSMTSVISWPGSRRSSMKSSKLLLLLMACPIHYLASQDQWQGHCLLPHLRQFLGLIGRSAHRSQIN